MVIPIRATCQATTATVTTEMTRQRKKKGRPVSGWLIFDKPKGMGSTEAVSKIKWLFKAEKAGHAGTLDPLASGMLPIALGEATKTVPYVMDGRKIYRFTVTWGAERSTDDLEGEVTVTSDTRPGRRRNQSAAAEIHRRHPTDAAQILRHQNRRRTGLRSRPRWRRRSKYPPAKWKLADWNLIEQADAATAIFEVECGKGTYVRSLARDMGRDLGCYGHISDLRRIEVAPFDESDFVTLAELEAAHPPVPTEEEGEDRSYERLAERFSVMDAFLIDTGAAL